jgi:hypothetical protein
MLSKPNSVKLSIESIPDGNRLILKAPEVPLFTKVFLGLLTLISVFFVLSVLIRSDVSMGLIVSAIVVSLILFFIIRLFLWNTFGREIFEVTKKSVRHYNDYKYFSHDLLKVENSETIYFAYHTLTDQDPKRALPLGERISTDEYYLTILDKNKELSKAHLSLNAGQLKLIFGLIDE